MSVQTQFDQIGARLKIHPLRTFDRTNFVINILRDEGGEYFDIRKDNSVQLEVINSDRKDRHLLLMTKQPAERLGIFEKAKFLCGHDERHWFTAAIPEGLKVSTVQDAKQALKPQEILAAERTLGVKTNELHKRHRRTEAGVKIHRQGEFMFIPATSFQEDKNTIIHKNEPMRRGRIGKPHMAQYLVRFGGDVVYEGRGKVLTHEQYLDLPNKERYGYTERRANATVYAKGKVSHPDHATLDLKDVWHQVHINTEQQSKAMRNLAFID